MGGVCEAEDRAAERVRWAAEANREPKTPPKTPTGQRKCVVVDARGESGRGVRDRWCGALCDRWIRRAGGVGVVEFARGGGRGDGWNFGHARAASAPSSAPRARVSRDIRCCDARPRRWKRFRSFLCEARDDDSRFTSSCRDFSERTTTCCAAWGSEKSQYVVAVADPGPLGMSLEHNDDGELVVVTTDVDKTVVRSNAGAAGVVPEACSRSYRSLDPRALRKSRSSVVLGEGVAVPTIEDLEAIPRPLELRLQLASAAPRHEGLNEKIDSMVREMRQVVVEKTLDATADEDEQDASKPAETWGNTTGEQYVLNWEPTTLRTLGATIQFVAGKYAVSMAAPSILAKTALSSIARAVAWPVTLMTVADYLDNPWSMARAKATIAGEEIANALLTQQHGRRP